MSPAAEDSQTFPCNAPSLSTRDKGNSVSRGSTMWDWQRGPFVFSLLLASLPVLKKLHLWLFTAAILTVISAALTFPRAFGFARSAPLKHISSGSGYLYSAPLPDGLRHPPKRRILPADKPALTENGRSLLHPNAGRKAIARDGEGRFRIAGNIVSFSSSDHTSPVENGRHYVITVSAFRAVEWLLSPFGPRPWSPG